MYVLDLAYKSELQDGELGRWNGQRHSDQCVRLARDQQRKLDNDHDGE